MKNQINNTELSPGAIKLLLILPLIILPLATFAFWTFTKKQSPGGSRLEAKGINTALPGAQFDKKAKPQDKMSFYALARQDALKTSSASPEPAMPGQTQNGNAVSPEQAVTRINQRLAAINGQIGRPPQTPATPAPIAALPANPVFEGEVNKLEKMMGAVASSQQDDPEMQRLNVMLDKIAQLQHPEGQTTPTKPTTKNPDSAFRAIPAVVDGNQKVLQGGVVRLRLTDSTRLKNQLLPKGQLLYGASTVINQRLLLEIKNVRIGEAIIAVNLTVFSLDGMAGIPAPEAELTGAAATGTNNALEGMEFLSADQSLAAQAAAGGIEAAKGLFSKKLKRVKVRLRGGYPVLLKNNKS